MKCVECGASCIEVRGELSCVSCGLVGERVFEPTDRFDSKELVRHKDTILGSVIGTDNIKGWAKLRRLAVTSGLTKQQNYQRDINFHISVTASEFNLSESAKSDMRIYYDRLRKEHIFTTRMRYEERMAAIGYMVLKEHGYSYTLKEVSKILEIPSKTISRLSRLYARNLGKSHVFSSTNYNSLLEKFCSKLGKDRSFINDCINLYSYLDKIDSNYPSSSHLSGIVYFVETTKPVRVSTQKQIASEFGISVMSVKNHYNKILNLLAIKNTNGLTVDNIVEGIR
tara:strand:- start:5708 stop:6556 length:849 start_codon:yes stop_codon:yes gene_type:complete